MLLAVMWVLPGTSILAAELLDNLTINPPIHDMLFVVVFLGTAQLLGVSFLVWRRFVTWTLGRYLSTGAVTVAVLAHVLVWQPIWQAGCVEEDFLRLGQSCALGGVWVVVAAYLWWGIAEGVGYLRRRVMPPYAVRLIYGFALVPFIPGLWVILAMLAVKALPGGAAPLSLNRDNLAIMLANFVCGLLVVIWWSTVWRRAVHWTRGLARRSAALAAAYLVIVTLVPIRGFNSDWVDSLPITGPLILTGLWFVITTRMWRPHTAEGLRITGDVKSRLVCVTCGYSLIGLREARCPECGEQSTLDELFEKVFAAQAGE